MEDRRIVCWFSRGCASAIATTLTLKEHPEAVIACCVTGSEHADNDRFEADWIRRWNRPVEHLKSDQYTDTWDVWERRRFMAGRDGAPCTVELKVGPRLAWQRPTDIHVFGYTADKADVTRAKRLRDNYPELTVWTPLIDAGLDKAACLAMTENAGITPPVTYAMGYPNANCIPCVKATSPDYWALVRKMHPEEFERAAKLSRELGARLARINDERIFIDEIPADWPTTNPIAPACDFLCHLAEQDMAEKAA